MINIKEPCHEKWDEFSPTEQGAFCSKCQIDVVDFSVKTNQEVLQFFKTHAGQKMCGRFKQTQINDFNIEFYEWEQQSHQTFQAKFALTLIIVFGLTLFSCSTSKEIQQVKQSIEETRVEIDTLQQTNLMELNNVNDTLKVTNFNHDSLYSTPEISLKLDEIYTQGGFGIPELIQFDVTTMCEMFTMGDMMIPENIDLISQNNNLLNKIKPISLDFSVKLNQKFNYSVLTIQSRYNENLTINMHDKNGNLTLPIHQDYIQKGSTSFNLNFKDIPSDTYYIVVVSPTKKEIIKINI